MSIDYPEYEKMKRRHSPARWFWICGDRLYYIGLLMSIIWPLATASAWFQSSSLSLPKAVIVWSVIIVIFFAGVGLKSLSYRIARREGIDI